jgi:hypothetical protein
MAFPISLDNFTPRTDGDDDVMAVDVNELQTAIEALETKIGITNSLDTDSLDYKIRNMTLDLLTDVVIDTPVVDQVLRYNGVAWVNGNEVTVNGGSGVDFFYVDSASDIGGYNILSKVPDAGAEQDDSAVVNNNKVLIESYISPAGGLGGSQIDAGVWTFDAWGYVSSTVGVSILVFDVYKRTAAGAETLLFSLNSLEINSTSIIDISPNPSVQQAFAINATDRLLVKVSAQTDAVTDKTVHFIHGGTTHYSHFNTPLVVRHNDLSGLQGGTSGEYYHITAAELTVLQNTSGENTGDQTLNDLRPVKSGTFASGSTTYVKTDAAVTSASIIDVYAQSAPVGAWSVESADGSFTITSTETETGNIDFKYFINN